MTESATPNAFAGGVAPVPARTPKPRKKPRLRGVSHQIAALASLPAAGALFLRAKGTTGTAGAVVYGATLVLLFSVSAVYHRMYWPLSIRRIIGRVDHAAIFLLIAGTYTPFGLLLGPGLGYRLLALVWIGALAGIVTVVWLTGTPKPVRASLYVLLGWFILPVIPGIRAGLGDEALALLIRRGRVLHGRGGDSTPCAARIPSRTSSGSTRSSTCSSSPRRCVTSSRSTQPSVRCAEPPRDSGGARRSCRSTALIRWALDSRLRGASPYASFGLAAAFARASCAPDGARCARCRCRVLGARRRD